QVVASAAGSGNTVAFNLLNDVPMQVSVSGPPAPKPEGTAVTFTGSFTDVNDPPTGPYNYEWQVVDSKGQPIADEFGSVSAPEAVPSFSITNIDSGNYTVSLNITDKYNISGSQSAVLTVSNVPPTATITGLPATGHSPEGTAISLGSSVTDPSPADTTAGFTYAWNVTKNGVAYASGTTANVSSTPDNNGTYVVTLTATDKDGGISPAAQTTITVDNVAPTASITGAPASGHSPEGTAISLGNTVTDPTSADTGAGFTYAWNVTKNGVAYAKGTA